MCLSQTFSEIEEMKKAAHLSSPSLYNLVLTDGKALIAARFSTQPDKETRSLHIAYMENVMPVMTDFYVFGCRLRINSVVTIGIL